MRHLQLQKFVASESLMIDSKAMSMENTPEKGSGGGYAASTIAEICSFRITYERLKSDEYGKHTREGIWRRISNSGCC